MHVARAWLGVASVNGEIYAIGGSNASGFEPASFPYGNIDADHFVGTNEEYDPSTNSWSSKAPMPTPRMAFAIAAIQGKIYCIGGRSIAGDMSGGYTAVNEVYDPLTDSWENKAPMPIVNGWIEAKVFQDKIYIKNFIPNTPSDQYYVYDPASDTWNSSVPSPQDGKLLFDYIPNGYETTGVMSPKVVYTFSEDSSLQVKAYYPENSTWQNGAASSLIRDGFGITVANDIFYVVGGYTYSFIGDFAPLAANEEYVPFGYGTPDSLYLSEHTPPQVSFQSPTNQTYHESSIPITFYVNKNITEASYSLDGQTNVTVTGNTTLANIPNGLHNLTLYAHDVYGNVGNQTVTFTVEKRQIESIVGTNNIGVIAVPVAIVCLIIGVLLYRRHRKNR